MPRCYMVKKRIHEDSPSPCSPTEGSIAPHCYDQNVNAPPTETRKTENAERTSIPLSERSAAETEAAHELLSLAHSLPPLPTNQTLLTQQPQPSQPPQPQLLPVYTYAIQPTNIFIVTDKDSQPAQQSSQDAASYSYNYTHEPYFGYISYQPAPPKPVVIPPTPVFPFRSGPDPVSDVDSDDEPQLEIASDLEIDTEHETESETEYDRRKKPVYRKAVPRYPIFSDSKPMQLGNSELQVKPFYYTETVSTSQRSEELAPRSTQKTESTQLMLKNSQFYTESETRYLSFSNSDRRLTSFSKSLPPIESKSNYRANRVDLGIETLPRGVANEGNSSRLPWASKKYDCTECGKRYATSSNLSRHKQTHRSLDSILAKRCGECGKVYVSMPALAMHVLTHRMNHVCGICGKQFSRPWLLRGHLRSHTGEKPYTCEACGKAFADRSNLRAHLQTHASNRKYQCQYCNKSFAVKSYLNKHQETACFFPENE